MYAPEAFGLMAVCTSLAAVAGVMAGLRYEQAILLPERDEDGINVLALSLLITAGFSGALGLLLLFCRGPILRLFGAAKLGGYVWFIPASVLVSGFYQSIVMWNARQRDFGVVSGSRALASGLSNTCQLSFGFVKWTTAGSLIGGAFAGNSVGLAMAAVNAWRRSRQLLLESVRWVKVRWALKRYSEFPLYNSWGILLNTLSWQLPALLLARYFGSASAGYFSIGMRVLSVPMDVIAVSIGQVFFQRAAEARSAGNLPEVVEAALQRLIAFGIFPVVMMSLVAPDLFAIVFGNQWRPAGAYVQILAAWICVWFISSPLTVLVAVLEEQKFYLWMNCLILSSRWASIGAGAYLHRVHAALVFYSVSGVLVYGYQGFVLVLKAGASVTKVASLLGRYAWPAGPAAAIILAARRAGASSIALTSLAGLLTVAYIGLTAFLDPAIWSLLSARAARLSTGA
jgi:O-antigen/teichoic acid export membrane protein